MGVYGYFNRPVYDDDTQIVKSWDIEQMRNCAHKFAFYEANNERERGMAECWVSEPENAKTASYGMNWGYYYGLDEVKKFYLDPAKTANFVGGMIPMSSWVIEQSHEEENAQGIFYAIWYDIQNKGDEDEAYWYSAKIGIDFVKEADGWKIWHYFMGVDVSVKAGESFGEQKSTIEKDPNFVNPLQAYFGEPTIPVEEAYTTKYNWSHYPPLPTPHATYAETTNCGPTGNPNYKG